MLFKYFTDRSMNSSVAVNPANVSHVTEFQHGGCRIYFIDGKTIDVTDGYMDVAVRLSEK
jgi:hypothetical protein